MATASSDIGIRVAAVADLHFGNTDDPATLADELGRAGREADVLLIAGDLTSHGRREHLRAEPFVQR